MSFGRPASSVARTVPTHGVGGHGEPARSTGHVGPAVTVPKIPDGFAGLDDRPHAMSASRRAVARILRMSLGRARCSPGSRPGQPPYAEGLSVPMYGRFRYFSEKSSP